MRKRRGAPDVDTGGVASTGANYDLLPADRAAGLKQGGGQRPVSVSVARYGAGIWPHAYATRSRRAANAGALGPGGGHPGLSGGHSSVWTVRLSRLGAQRTGGGSRIAVAARLRPCGIRRGAFACRMNKRGDGLRRALLQRRGGCPARGSAFPQTVGVIAQIRRASRSCRWMSHPSFRDVCVGRARRDLPPALSLARLTGPRGTFATGRYFNVAVTRTSAS
ncbi:hypothetical protein LMG24235_08067 [Paraburkholderia sabiae]|nr:hypothetical protein LMG24235_08067 [Paraburkholderia sabiae]